MSATTIPMRLTKLAGESQQNKERAEKLEKEKAVLKERVQLLTEQVRQLTARAEAGEAAHKQAAEALSVAQAERRLVDESRGHSDTALSELRTERASLSERLSESQAMCITLQQERFRAEEARGELERDLSVANAERRLLDEHAQRAATQLHETLRATAEYKSDTDGRLAALEASRDELRAERASLQESLSVAQSERRQLKDSMTNAAVQASSELATARGQLTSAEARAEESARMNARGEAERAQLRQELAVALAEKRLLQDLASRMQAMQLDDRSAYESGRERAEAVHCELCARLEVAESSARSSEQRLAALETDRQWLSEKHSQLTSELKAVHTERRTAEEGLREAQAQLQAAQLERAAAESTEARLRELGSVHAVSEAERIALHEQLTTAQAKLAEHDDKWRASEAALRAAECALQTVRSDLALEQAKEREREERVCEFQRQRDTVQRERARLQEQLAVCLSPPTPKSAGPS